MKRRTFIAALGGAAAWPLVASGQHPDKPLIGFLSARSAKESADLVESFCRGLAQYGVLERQNAIIDYSWADSHYDRLSGQARDLVSRRPAVFVSVGGDMTAKAAVSATRTIPIVAVFIGPCGRGICWKPESTRRQCYGRQQSKCCD
jgi:putative ABC transport system substrate-binding protein